MDPDRQSSQQGMDWERIRRVALVGARAGGAEGMAEDVAHEAILALVRAGARVDREAFVFTKARWLALSYRRSELRRTGRETEWCRSEREARGVRSERALLASIPEGLPAASTSKGGLVVPVQAVSRPAWTGLSALAAAGSGVVAVRALVPTGLPPPEHAESTRARPTRSVGTDRRRACMPTAYTPNRHRGKAQVEPAATRS